MTALLLVPAQEHDGSFRTGGRTGRLSAKVSGKWSTTRFVALFSWRGRFVGSPGHEDVYMQSGTDWDEKQP